MTKYRLLAPHIVDGAYCETGSEVDIDYEPGPQMEPLDAEGRRKLEAFNKERAELEPDYPNFGWPLIDKYWFGSLVRERLRDLAQERRAHTPEPPPPPPPEPPPPPPAANWRGRSNQRK